MIKSLQKPLFVFFLIIFISCENSDKKYASWLSYSGDPTGSKYSSLDQVNTTNVKNLKLLWTYEVFDKKQNHRNETEELNSNIHFITYLSYLF